MKYGHCKSVIILVQALVHPILCFKKMCSCAPQETNVAQTTFVCVCNTLIQVWSFKEFDIGWEQLIWDPVYIRGICSEKKCFVYSWAIVTVLLITFNWGMQMEGGQRKHTASLLIKKGQFHGKKSSLGIKCLSQSSEQFCGMETESRLLRWDSAGKSSDWIPSWFH